MWGCRNRNRHVLSWLLTKGDLTYVFFDIYKCESERSSNFWWMDAAREGTIHHFLSNSLKKKARLWALNHSREDIYGSFQQTCQRLVNTELVLSGGWRTYTKTCILNSHTHTHTQVHAQTEPGNELSQRCWWSAMEATSHVLVPQPLQALKPKVQSQEQRDRHPILFPWLLKLHPPLFPIMPPPFPELPTSPQPWTYSNWQPDESPLSSLRPRTLAAPPIVPPPPLL